MKRSTKSFSFLLEFIIVLFFFALSSAICVSVQGQAQQINTQANDTKVALQILQNYVANDCEGAKTYDAFGKQSNTAYFEIQEVEKGRILEVGIYHEDQLLASIPYYRGDAL